VRVDVPGVAGGLRIVSGICAVWHKENPEQVAGTLRAMNGVLATSPDTSTYEIAGEAALAVHARFDGQQLFRNGRVLLACDADLLNERELAQSAGLAGRPSTAALLASLYEKSGDRFVEQLQGGFAVILWDLVNRRLVAGIDGFGIRRLAWYDDGRKVLLASRADAVRAGAPGLAINAQAIANILNFSVNLGPETIFKGVRRLGPGAILTASNGPVKVAPYWTMRYGLRNDNKGSLSRELESVLERSVAEHCANESADALGSFLSGGTDSSTVVGLMTRAAGAPVKAFSIGFQENGFDELDYAKLAAKAFGATHHTYLVSASDCLDSLDAIIGCFDEPFGNSSAIATYFCARLAADNGVRALLAGDGGDELFGGNERYATEKIFEAYRYIPAPLRSGLIEPLAALPIDITLMRRARGYIRRAKMPGVERMLSFQFLRTHALGDVFDGDFLRALGDYSVVDIPGRHYDAAPAATHLDRLLYVDMNITIADNDLPKVTCMSELAGVRPRFPFLDRNVAEFSGRVPARLKVKGFKKRYLFKQAFRTLLPREIVEKKKHGFGVPVAVWMKSDPRLRELTYDTLLSNRSLERGYFRESFVRDLLDKHEADAGVYYGDTIWTFLMLELWHRQRVDEPVRVVA
jgi:asparagine synthase (glutamine-hydrolysing)